VTKSGFVLYARQRFHPRLAFLKLLKPSFIGVCLTIFISQNIAALWRITVSETVSENTERVVKNTGELSQILLDIQREKPYSPRI
jgi:hypothetical protein